MFAKRRIAPKKGLLFWESLRREEVAAHRQLTDRSEPKENGYTEPLPELTEAEISLWWPRPGSNR